VINNLEVSSLFALNPFRQLKKKLPDNLEVGGNLYLSNTPLSKKYTKQQVKDLIEEKGGYVNKYIFT
jgi:hypothetical protein